MFRAELERGEGNDFVNRHNYHPTIINDNRLLLIEVSNLKDFREATQLRNMAAQLPLTVITFIGYDDRSVKIIVKYEVTGYDDVNTTMRDAFRNVQQFYSAQLGVMPDITDPSTTQLRTLSYDPEAYYNEGAIPFYLSSHNPYSTATVKGLYGDGALTDT